MAYISFRDLPIYIAAGDNALAEGESSSLMVHANQGSISYTPNVQSTRLLGQTPDAGKDYLIAGPFSASLSFSFFLKNGEFIPTNFTGSDSKMSFAFGDKDGLRGTNMYLNSFSYTLAPYAPVQVNCEFGIYSKPEGKIASVGTTNLGPQPGAAASSQYAHGAYSTLTNPVAGTLTVENAAYQFTTSRQPVYAIGALTPSEVLQLTAEHQVSIAGDNIDALVGVGGVEEGAAVLDLKAPSAPTVTIMKSTVNGIVTAQTMNASAGGVAQGTTTIQQSLL